MTVRLDRWLTVPVFAACLMALLPAAADSAPDRNPVTVARDALDQGDAITAEIEAQQALRSGADRRDVAALLGQAELFQGNFDKARQWLEPGRFTKEDHERGFHALAQLELAEGHPEKAAKAFERALEHNGGSALLWVDIGRFRYQIGEQRLAVTAARNAVKKDPDNPQALVFMGQLVRDTDGLQAGLLWFRRGIDLHPENLDLLAEYASTLAELGQYKEMLRVTRDMLTIQPGNSRAYLLQSVMAARAGEGELAQRLFWRTRNQFDAVPAGMLIAGVMEQYGGNRVAAAHVLNDLVRRQPDNLPAHIVLGRALLTNGETGEVVDDLKPLAKRASASAYMLTLLGRALEQRDDRQAAAIYLDRAAGIGRLVPPAVEAIPLSEEGAVTIYRWQDDPDRLDAGIALIRQMLGEGQERAALAKVADLRARYPASIDVEILSGDVAALTEQEEEALKYYRQAAQLRLNADLTQRIVYTLLAMNRQAEAERLLSDYLRENPRALEAVLMLADLRLKDSEWHKADLLLTYARQLPGGARDPRLLAHLSEACLQQGKIGQAMDLAMEAYRIQRAGTLPTLALGRAMAAAGRRKEAAVLMEKYRAMDGAADQPSA
ncbi:hypothetical protein D6851_01645 [Altericroceibacterium spongiae]|uniref:Tetratricopeptide repeat protein n=1 Tax=Altericroceibacterium spongiae TaxID=2320269 RepID=A0A420ERB8_9SPHN|nr:tetratricopeptide repeat protein [Altericroceibacterium spongiae]RKF23211.1 hypothetical protein D6851_01645 [Altericroceibacterium spongiae]